ncbi:hypothetical protein BH09ACT6_BH09ACT6_02680 [soil metagenome]
MNGYRESRRGRPRSTRRRWSARARIRALRVGCALVVLLSGAIYLGSGIGTTISAGSAWPANWQIAACDIGQGDAVVVHDADRFALVDVGPDPALLTTCLNRLSITRIDLLVLTHYDLDHVGGLSAVLGRVSVVLLGPPEDSRDAAMADRLAKSGAEVRHARRGDSGELGALAWNILWPPADTALRGNDASVTIEFTGSLRSLFLGDLGEDSQRLVMAANVLNREDVVKVAHHGSADQSEDFYQAIRATVGLVSVGANNRYGHPTDRLLAILARSGTAAYRTDLLGMIVVAPSPDGMIVWSDAQARVEKKK